MSFAPTSVKLSGGASPARYRLSTDAVLIGWRWGSIQFEGTARIVGGDERRAKEQPYKEQRPASRVADPSLAIIVVTLEWLCRYDTAVEPPQRLDGARPPSER